MRLPMVAATRRYEVGPVGHYATHGEPDFTPPKHKRLLTPRPVEDVPDFETGIDRLARKAKAARDAIPDPERGPVGTTERRPWSEAEDGLLVRCRLRKLTDAETAEVMHKPVARVKRRLGVIRVAFELLSPRERGAKGGHAKRGKAEKHGG